MEACPRHRDAGRRPHPRRLRARTCTDGDGQRDVGPGATFPVGDTTLSCTATDVFGNSFTRPLLITVTDTRPPVLTVPAEVRAPAAGPVTFVATAIDAVDGPITPSCNPPSGGTFAAGVATVTCTATDTHGQSASASFPVIVAANPPTLNTPGDLTFEATGSSGRTISLPVTVSSTTPPAPTPDCTAPIGTDGASVHLTLTADTFPLGITPVSCSVTGGGNTVTRTFRVTVQDTTPPNITVPALDPFSSTNAAGAIVDYMARTDAPTATDSVSGAAAVTCSPRTGTVFPIGTTTVSCQAIDKADNQGFKTFTITVVDREPPVFDNLADVTLDADDFTGKRVSLEVKATDPQDGQLPASSVRCAPAVASPGTWFPLGRTTVSCTASDSADPPNETHGSFVIEIVDQSPPTVTVPGPIVREATGPGGASVPFEVSVSDLVDRIVSPICMRVSGSAPATPVTNPPCSRSARAWSSARRPTTPVTRNRIPSPASPSRSRTRRRQR